MQKQVKVKVKALLNVKVKVFYFGYKQQQMDKSVLVLTQTMFPTTIPRQFYFDNKQLKGKSYKCYLKLCFYHDPRAELSPWRNVVGSTRRLGSPLPAIVHWELSEIRHYNEDGCSLHT